MMEITKIREAVSRGWCSKENECKEIDVVLAEAIAQEVKQAIVEATAEQSEEIERLKGVCASTLEAIGKSDLYGLYWQDVEDNLMSAIEAQTDGEG